LLVLSVFVRSQNYIDLFKADFSSTPQNKFDTSNASTSLTEINSDLTIPIPINESFTILSGLTYEMTSASFNPNRKRETLTGLTLKLGANVKHNSKWGGTYLLLPKVSSDLKNASNQDFQLGAAVLMKYTKSDHFNYRLGMYANSELFGPFIVPIFGFYYLNPTEKFEVKVLLPLSVDLNYLITDNAKLGLNFKGQIRTYNLHTPIDAETNRYAARSTNDVYSYFQYGINNGINFQVGVGRSVGRSYRIYDEVVSFATPLAYFGDNREQLNTDFADGWLFKVAAFYRLKL
jgi:hypothetical protein